MHNKQIIKFNNQQKNIPNLMKILKKLILNRDKLEDKNKIKLMNIRIDKLKQKIIKYKKKENIINYYLNTGGFLHNYYNNKKSKKINNNIDNITNNPRNNKQKISFVKSNINLKNHNNHYENNKNNSEIKNKSNKEDDNNPNSIINMFNNPNKLQQEHQFKNTKISNFIKTESNFDRTEYLDNYLKIMNKNYTSHIIYDKNINMCENCNIELVEYKQSGVQICSKCGIQKRYIIENDKPSFKDPPPEVSYFAYKRINHFNECLTQFQGKESTIIPQEIYDKLLIEIKKERITNLATLNYEKIRKYLKKLKLNKYYEHIPHILNRINGIPPPTLSKQLEEKLRLMFKEIQIPFREVCPKTRKNFLSYYYILHKFVELLDLDEFKYYFPLTRRKTNNRRFH